MGKLLLAATILASSLTFAQAQTVVMMPRPPSPYYAPTPYGYAPYPYTPYYPHRLHQHAPNAPVNPGIASVQRRLSDLGFLSVASFDGVAGSRTQAAIANWQRSIGHPRTGRLTPAEVQALFEPAQTVPVVSGPQVFMPPTSSEVLGQAASMSALAEITR